MYFCFFRLPFSWVSVLLISIFTRAMRCKPRSAVFIIKVDQVAIILVFCIKNFPKKPKCQRSVDGPDLRWTKSKVETQIIFTATNWSKTWQCPDPSGFEPLELPSGLKIKAGPVFWCSNSKKTIKGITILTYATFQRRMRYHSSTAEIIQIKLKDTIPTSQFWTDVAHNGNQIDFIGNE